MTQGTPFQCGGAMGIRFGAGWAQGMHVLFTHDTVLLSMQNLPKISHVNSRPRIRLTAQ